MILITVLENGTASFVVHTLENAKMSPKKKSRNAKRTKIPNPGSKAAIKKGCICPVLDNNHGRGIPWPDCKKNVFWVNTNCKIHSKLEVAGIRIIRNK